MARYIKYFAHSSKYDTLFVCLFFFRSILNAFNKYSALYSIKKTARIAHGGGKKAILFFPDEKINRVRGKWILHAVISNTNYTHSLTTANRSFELCAEKKTNVIQIDVCVCCPWLLRRRHLSHCARFQCCRCE